MLELKPYHLCFETLANELRIKIIELLSIRAMNVNEISERLGAERSRVSNSLHVLKGCNVVESKKLGKNMLYSLKDKSYLKALQSGNSVFSIIDEHINTYCDSCYKLKT